MSEQPHITIKDIIEAVALHYSVTPAAIRSSRKDGLVSRARHVVCWLAGRQTETTNMAIGRELHCDHSVAIRGRREIEELREQEPAIRDLLDGLEAATLAVATLRARQIIPPPRHIDAYEVAARVAVGGSRAAGMAAIAEIIAVCETLDSFAKQHHDRLRDDGLRSICAEVVEARAAAGRALYTPGEKHARARLERALDALLRELSEQQLEQANG